MINHKSDYLILAIFCAGYVVFIFRYQATPHLILLSTLTFALTYILWGIWHHFRSGSFHAKIVLEYFLVSLLGVAVVSTLLL